MKKKRRSKKGKISLKTFLITILCGGCIITAGFFLSDLRHFISSSTSSGFEELHSRSSELDRKIARIDNLLYQALYRGRIESKDIYFSEVTPVNVKGYDWEFTEVTVKVPDKAAAYRLGDVLQDELIELKPDVLITSGEISDKDVVYNISSLGLHTHRIRLVYRDGLGKPYRDLPKIAIIIDDIGNDKNLASSLMDMGLAITLSVLPSSTYGREIAEEANTKGFEVMLHLPMEPQNYPAVNPGPDALLIKMDERQIKAILDKNLKSIPGVSGVNNHMGSHYTENEDKMAYVMKELKKRGLYYLDSRTTAGSVGFKLARAWGVRAGQKSVFLDNDPSAKAVKYQMERLVGIARYSGEAIGIGHPHEVTLNMLKEYADLLKSDFKLVPVSDLVK
jgi:uncharacterized protein